MTMNSSIRPTDFQQAKAEQFAERISNVLDSGALCIMLAIGHRTGLLDTMKKLPAATSAAIADAAELNERYVREWLAAMVTGRVVEYDPESRTYFLPQEHAECVTRDAALGNMALYTQHVAMLGVMHESTAERFVTGEGTRYADYPCFHEIMAEDSGLTVVSGLFDAILPLVDGVEQRLLDGIRVLDAGCGRGLAILALAQRYPNSHFTGYDLCEDAIEYANQQVKDWGLNNAYFEVRDLSHFNEKQQYDFITSFDAVHDQRSPQQLIQSLYDALRDGGIYLMQDIGASAQLQNNMDFPLATMLYAVSCCHCMPVSLGQGGEGLGTMWGWETAQAMLTSSGFRSVQRHVLPHDPTNVWFVSVK